MYNGIKAAHAAKPELGLGDSIKYLETTYSHVLSDNANYLKLANGEQKQIE